MEFSFECLWFKDSLLSCRNDIVRHQVNDIFDKLT